MRHISTTPFGRRPVTAGLLASQALAEAPAPDTAPDKWALLRDLTAARLAYGVSDRDLAVLSGLLSFHPGKELADDDGLIVFPSNIALSERVHGMAESTLRRHIAALVQAGLIARRDSPNGKRYATRDMGGALDRVFGFDLRPLLVRSAEIAELARAARAEALSLRRLREAVIIRLRDAAKLLAWLWDAGHDVAGHETQLRALQRRIRRRLDADDLRELGTESEAMLGDIRQVLRLETEEMSGNDIENERHYQNSNPYPYDIELCQEKAKAAGVVSERIAPKDEPSIPLALVLKAVPDIRDYAPGGLRSWRDLVAVADFVRPMLGVSPDAWAEARRHMGDINAAVTLACILQRSGEIMRPGGYLRALTEKAAGNGFSPGPMVMALLRAENTRAV
ncbi:MAG: plasmid replication protein RepC [Paracoccus sp. (in: a-proteobacteria)]|nr:plasmid replication protein RepC [Paracoccus sp. (in: a-proteobacteria)]